MKAYSNNVPTLNGLRKQYRDLLKKYLHMTKDEIKQLDQPGNYKKRRTFISYPKFRKNPFTSNMPYSNYQPSLPILNIWHNFILKQRIIYFFRNLIFIFICHNQLSACLCFLYSTNACSGVSQCDNLITSSCPYGLISP